MVGTTIVPIPPGIFFQLSKSPEKAHGPGSEVPVPGVARQEMTSPSIPFQCL